MTKTGDKTGEYKTLEELGEGDSVGEYRILGKLGEGNFGWVYLAEWNTRKGTKQGALKILKAPKFKDILEEVSNWGQVSHHENVLTFFGAKQYEDKILIVSEYVPDGSLEDWLEKHNGKAPSIEIAVKLMLGVLRGLEHLHNNEILHRDLKPANILLKGETPLLADFGFARGLNLVNSDRFAGTLIFAPPEALQKAERTEHFDLWAATVTFYILLTGTFPFDTIKDILLQNHILLSLDIPEELRNFFDKAFQKDAENRFQTASEMQLSLDQTLSTLRFKAAKLKETIVDDDWQTKQARLSISNLIEEDFGSILGKFEVESRIFHPGELVEGTVVGVSERGVLIDFGYKSEGIAPIEDFTNADGNVTAKKGETLEVVIERIPSGDAPPILSRMEAMKHQSWGAIEKAFNDEVPITGRVVEVTKG